MKKSNIVKVTVITSTLSTVIVTYASGRTRTSTLEHISKNALAFITGNLNTIVKEHDDRVTTTFYADEKAVDNDIVLTKEFIIRKATTSAINATYYFKGEKFTIETTDFKICVNNLMFSLGLNRAFTVNFAPKDYKTLTDMRQRVIKNFYGI